MTEPWLHEMMKSSQNLNLPVVDWKPALSDPLGVCGGGNSNATSVLDWLKYLSIVYG